MIRKRLIGMITVRDGIAVQSFGYRRYLPLGKPEVLAANLDRWGADEIVVSAIDRHGKGPDMPLIERIAAKGIGTPLVYGGGIRGANDARAAIGAGADRVHCDALLHDDPPAVHAISEAIGAQGLIGSIPLSVERGSLMRYDYRNGRPVPLGAGLRALIASGALSELLVSDWRHEGEPAGFDPMIVSIGQLGLPLILFGGISDPAMAKSLLAKKEVVAIAVGNFLSYGEHRLQQMREAMGDDGLRPVVYREDEQWR